MSLQKRAYIELHIAVLLFGFTAILGNLIQMNALLLVWWRVGITSVSLLFLLKGGQAVAALSREDIIRIVGIGLLVTVHWLAFYGAIKVSNASIALVSLATTSFFTAILEPLVTRQRFKWAELGLGLLILPGMMLIVGGLNWSQYAGIALGLVAALLQALFGTLNKVQVGKKINPFALTFIQLGSSWLFLSLLILPARQLLPSFSFSLLPPRAIDWVYLLALALGCTTLGYVLFLRALRHISAFASSLTVNLEPVYGIVLAWLLLGEDKELSFPFYAGSAVIVLAVLLYPLVQKRALRKRSEDQSPVSS
ncbi:MAG: DMT family transporter [Haliscomenobacter sp.]